MSHTKKSFQILRFIGVRLGLIITSIVITLLLLELLVCLLMPQQLILVRPDIWVPVERYGWQQGSHLNTEVNTGERTIQLITDGRGYRISSNPVEQADYNILAVGDSFVAALQVNYEDTLTARLEKNLSQSLSHSVKLVNAGVGAWNPNHYLFRVEEALSQESYDLILVFLYMGNDVISHRSNGYRPIPDAFRHELRWPTTLSKAELVDAVAYPLNDYLETHSHLYILLRDKGRFIMMRLGLSAYYFADSMLVAEANKERWDITADIAADIATTAQETPILFILLPTHYQVDESQTEDYLNTLDIDPNEVDLTQPNQLLSTKLIERGLTVVDTTPALKAAYEEEGQELYGRIDTHFSPNGHHTVANFLTPLIQDWLSEP